jgi:preprotein translocase subunit SecY
VNLRETLVAAWATPDLRARILFVFAIFGVFVVGLHIPVPVPGIDPAKVQDIVESSGLLLFLNLFGGGALSRLSIFSLTLNPYITASIVMQLMTVGVPSLQKMQREEGEYGRRKINRYTRWLTLLLCLFQGWGYTKMIVQAAATQSGTTLSLPTHLMIVAFWTAGAMFLLWMGEQIQEKGVGNGVSLMIFAGIVVRLPYQVHQLYSNVQDGMVSGFNVVLLAAFFLATIWIIVYFTQAQRRIPIHHMRRIPGRRQVGSQTSYLPLSINTAGVIPIIFAISLLFLPGQFAQMLGERSALGQFFGYIQSLFRPGQSVWGAGLYTVLIFFFTYFYTAVIFNVEDMADNLKRSGAFVPGVRPGKPTQEYLDGVISRITVVGAAFLAFVALLQYWVPAITGTGTSFTLVGGTSMLIVVAVALDLMKQVEAQVIMRGYEEVH